MSERKLARVEKILNLEPIEGADRIEKATIGGWQVVVQKGLHQIQDKIVFCEIDSFLPEREEFEFLRKGSTYKVLADGSKGFRLKTIKLKGTVSQGLILPLSILDVDTPDIQFRGSSLDEGYDVTDLLNIKKYEPAIPANLGGLIEGYRPFWVPKTDEERVQNLSKELEAWQGLTFYVTEKLDGSSMSVYIREGKFGVCSRNLELKEAADNTLWAVARRLDLETKLRELNCDITIQGELIGEGIQKNPYGLKGQHFYLYNAFNPVTFKYYNFKQLRELADQLKIDSVPYLGDIELNHSMEELIKLANGNATFKSVPREGIVLRTKNRDRFSFKVISNDYLLGEVD